MFFYAVFVGLPARRAVAAISATILAFAAYGIVIDPSKVGLWRMAGIWRRRDVRHRGDQRRRTEPREIGRRSNRWS